jgi:hypothetical protein
MKFFLILNLIFKNWLLPNRKCKFFVVLHCDPTAEQLFDSKSAYSNVYQFPLLQIFTSYHPFIFLPMYQHLLFTISLSLYSYVYLQYTTIFMFLFSSYSLNSSSFFSLAYIYVPCLVITHDLNSLSFIYLL